MVRLFPPGIEVMAEDAVYQELEFPAAPAERPYVAINMVTTVDGKATIAGKAQRIGSSTDHVVMRRIRVPVDCVLNGAGTLRAEDINPSLPPDLQGERVARGLSAQPMAAVVSSTAHLPLQRRFFRSQEFESLVFTTERADPEGLRLLRQHAKVFLVGAERPDLGLVMKILRAQLGVNRLLVEGGPSVNYSLTEAGMADELFWTVSPRIYGARDARTMVEGPGLPVERLASLELLSAYMHESELYLRYRFRSPE